MALFHKTLKIDLTYDTESGVWHGKLYDVQWKDHSLCCVLDSLGFDVEERLIDEANRTTGSDA